MTTTKTGQRVGDWFLWIECEMAKTGSYRSVPIVTVRKAISGGDILATVVASRGMVNELRNAAAQIDALLDGMEGSTEATGET